MTSDPDSGPGTSEIVDWLVNRLAEQLELSSTELDIRAPFTSFGLASRDALVLSGELEEWLDRTLSPTLVYEYPTIESLAQFLSGASISQSVNGERAPLPAAHIAVVGLGCRLPGADHPRAFWDLLAAGVDAIREVPRDRWDITKLYDPDPSVAGKMSTRWGGFLDDISGFDASFFGISQREAVRMDPQQRLLLEVAWEALEDAGLDPTALAGTPTGVFVGISSNDYGQRQFSTLDLSDPYAGTGNALSIAANRLSYVFGFHGPSLAVDTACSSSLVALHLACRSLRDGECGLAIVGGVNLLLNPAITVNFSRAGFMARDGRCKAFDARGDGYVRSEGAGVVVLKPLEQAVADGDRIYAVVRGSAVNQDGRTNGLTAPSRQAQEAVLRAAYAAAGVSPAEVQYVEAHGTGTALGDPIEASALGAVLGVDRPSDAPCAIGSAKTNVGHLEAAAGVTGLMKVALALANEQLPPSLHFETPNPHIPFNSLGLRVQTSLDAWPASADRRRIAGVSSFGFGGTNAHVVLEGAPVAAAAPRVSSVAAASAYVLPLSARSESALSATLERWATFLHRAPAGTSIAALCTAAARRRAHHEHRAAVVGATFDELREALSGVEVGQARGNPRVAFVFGGQASQYPGMAQALLGEEPIFRDHIEQCDALMAPHLGWSVVELLSMTDRTHQAERLERTEVAQPTLFAIQVGLAALWQHWGITPGAVVGHSLGEIAAAHVAGVLDLPSAIQLVCARGTLLQRAHGWGRMLAVGLSADETNTVALRFGGPERVSVAATNGPRASVLAGDEATLRAIAEQVRSRGILARDLGGAYAFHRPELEPLARELEQALADLRPAPARLGLISTLTGERIAGEALDAAYWARQVTQPVQFLAAAEVLRDEGYTACVEIGPQPALGEGLRQTSDWLVLNSLRRTRSDRRELLGTLGQLYRHGCEVAWSALYPEDAHVDLPTYPWQRKRFWLNPPAPTSVASSAPSVHPLLGHQVSSPLLTDQLFESRIDLASLAYLADHQVAGMPVLPAAAYLELALAATRGAGLVEVRDLSLSAPMLLDNPRTVQVAHAPSTGEVRIVSRAADGDWQLHATALAEAKPTSLSPAIPLADAHTACAEPLDVTTFYADLSGRGLEYGPAFHAVRELWRGPRSALSRVAKPADNNGYHLHPALLDACLQTLGAALDDASESPDTVPVPIAVERFVFAGRTPRGDVWAYAKSRESSHPDLIVGDVTVYAADGSRVATLERLTLRRISRSAFAAHNRQAGHLYSVNWIPQPANSEPSATPRGPWLLVGDANVLADALRAAGHDCTVSVDSEATDASYANVVYQPDLDAAPLEATTRFVHLIRALVRSGSQQTRLWLVTRSAQVLTSDADPAWPHHAPLWGLAATAALEHPELRCVCIDVDDTTPPQALLVELLDESPEDRIALRGSSRFVQRLQPFESQPQGPVQLRRGASGLIDELTVHPLARRVPGPDEVQIEVRAAGLNFRDVLGTLNLYPGDPGPLGSECAGVITAVGSNVTNLKPGDAIVGVAPGSFATFAVTRAALV
ncbi:MAG TPA: beta-ketoacyl synthase N-terminal-like domain-containing protein, partial [Chloroflexota bacterium]